jgi:hypothetical protein
MSGTFANGLSLTGLPLTEPNAELRLRGFKLFQIVSLLDMVKINFQHIYFAGKSCRDIVATFPEAHPEGLFVIVDHMMTELLNVIPTEWLTVGYIKQVQLCSIKCHATRNYDVDELRASCYQLSNHIDIELSGKLFLHVPGDAAREYDNLHPFGSAHSHLKLNEKNRISFHLKQASDALALDMPTSCVVHLCLVMESATHKRLFALSSG